MISVKGSKKLIFLSLFLILYFFNSVGISTSSDKKEDIKIGFVDLNKVAEESLTGKLMIEGFQKEGYKKQIEIDNKKKMVENLRMELEKQGMLLSEKARKSKRDDLLREERDLKRYFSDSTEEFERKKAESEQELLERIIKTTKKIGEEEGYTVILSKQFLLFTSEQADLTKRIIKKIDAADVK